MNKREADYLAGIIRGILPSRVHIDVRLLGNGRDYACILDHYFYIWNQDDWDSVAVKMIAKYCKGQPVEGVA